MKGQQIYLFFLLSSPLFCLGSDLYVENGSQGGDGSENKPFGNFQDAMNAASDGDNIIGYGGSYPADKNVNLMIKKGESLSFLSKKKDNFTMVEIDLSDQTVPFLTSMSDSKVAIDSYKYSHHDSGHILDFTSGGKLEVKNCEFSNNYVSGFGSCIFGSGTGLNDAITIRNSLFSNNGNPQGGGYGSAILSLWNVIVFDSHFEMNNAVRGGAIYSAGQTFIQNSSFTNNYVSSMGGAIFLDNPPFSYVSESLFQENEANDSGGGICIINDNSTMDILQTTIENTNIYNNKCGSSTSQGDGAGIYIKNKNPTTVRVRNVTFVGNVINGGKGGRGGGLVFEGNRATLFQLSFSGNIAALGGGLAIIGSSEEVTDLREVVFYNNSARNYGGGYYCLLSNCSLAGIYQDNQAKYGGGVAVDQSTLTTLYQARPHNFYNNSAEMGGGMALLSGTNGIQNFVNFTQNSASKYGGAIYANQTGAITCGSFNFDKNSAQEGSNSYIFYGEGPMNNKGDRIVFNNPITPATLFASFLMDNRVNVDILFRQPKFHFGFIFDIQGRSTVNLCSQNPILQEQNPPHLELNGGNFLVNTDVSFFQTSVYDSATIGGSSDCSTKYNFPNMTSNPTFYGSINIEKGSIQGDSISFLMNPGTLNMEEYTKFDIKGKIEIIGKSSINLKRNSTLSPQNTSIISPTGQIYLEDNTTLSSKVVLVRDTKLLINRSTSINDSQPPNIKTITFDGDLTFMLEKKDDYPVTLLTYTQHSGKFNFITNSSYYVNYKDSSLLLHSGTRPLWELIVFCVVGVVVFIGIMVPLVWFVAIKWRKEINEEHRTLV